MKRTKLMRSTPAQPAQQSGATLIELMISVGLGLAVVASILTLFSSYLDSSRTSRATQSMNENAEAAFQIFAQQFKQAGFNPRQSRSSLPDRNPLQINSPPANEAGMSLFACDAGFANASGTSASDKIQNLTCATPSAAASSAAFAVQFEADQYSPSASAGIPLDCRGAAVNAQSIALTNPAGTAQYYVVENRFLINNNNLECIGNGGSTPPFQDTPRTLVSNIESMSLSFGVTAPNATGADASFSAGYLSAAELGPSFAGATTGMHPNLSGLTALARWNLVKVVRVCLIVRADRKTLFEPGAGSSTITGQYRGCNPSTLINITDGFERRAYVRHFALRNKIALPSS